MGHIKDEDNKCSIEKINRKKLMKEQLEFIYSSKRAKKM